ncbi:MAG: LysR family transcriptional regulator [Pseudomonadota bacterium]|nr:LysR family transcriptional regulator [Pseudomonadota bacterium]
MPKTNNQDAPVNSPLANLKRLAYFAAVVEAGSFTGAADRLGITKAVVSQQVARLEREFRATLLTRSTRHVAPTDAGQALYARCARILREADEAFNELAEVSDEPAGTLHMTAPLDYGITAIVPAVAEFVRRYPRCQVDVALSDQAVDMTAGAVELGIRVGWLTQPSVQARQIGRFRQLLVAPAAWHARVAALVKPQDIAALPFVANSALREPTRWRFARTVQGARRGGEAEVDVQAALRLNATLATREAVYAGVGLAVLPDYAAAEGLAAGSLIEVLPDWQLPAGGIHAVFPAARFRPAKVRAFVDLLVERAAVV